MVVKDARQIGVIMFVRYLVSLIAEGAETLG